MTKLEKYIDDICTLYNIEGIRVSRKYKLNHREEVTDYLNKLEPISSDAAMSMLITYLFGPDWYVTDPLGQDQINAIAVEDIIRKYKGF